MSVDGESRSISEGLKLVSEPPRLNARSRTLLTFHQPSTQHAVLSSFCDDEPSTPAAFCTLMSRNTLVHSTLDGCPSTRREPAEPSIDSPCMLTPNVCDCASANQPPGVCTSTSWPSGIDDRPWSCGRPDPLIEKPL